MLQCWWRRAGQLGLRQKKFINDTKIMIFNFELLAFMKLEDARKYYKLVLEAIPKIDKFDEFIFYFEETWFLKNNEANTKYEFTLWGYSGKFNFSGTKKELIKSGDLEKYILFSNNAVESFNHIMNQCLYSNSRVSISKFEEIFKYIFIRMNSNTNKNDNLKEHIRRKL